LAITITMPDGGSNVALAKSPDERLSSPQARRSGYVRSPQAVRAPALLPALSSRKSSTRPLDGAPRAGALPGHTSVDPDGILRAFTLLVAVLLDTAAVPIVHAGFCTATIVPPDEGVAAQAV
jgi:hypothetical protein